MKIIKGDIFTSTCEALVNPVNIVGVMGAGLAFQFKKRFSTMFTEYHYLCRQGKMAMGKMHVWKGEKIIINFPTKNHYRDRSKLEDIALGIEDLKQVVILENIKSLAVPALGCGLGGLKLGQVLPLLKKLDKENFQLEVYLQ